jgi:4-amino-4-deoxy-L-arabinose transferase-like glycosyltransferase
MARHQDSASYRSGQAVEDVPLSSADHLPLSPCPDPPPGARRGRWVFWRSPPGQPAWARPAVLGIAAAAAVLYGRNITEAGFAPFYSVAVKSMSVSWKAFFYGAFDPAATITIDKLAGSFVPQALSARVFGFHPWSLALPQVIEGVVAVLVMYRVVRRWAGVVPGLLAAGIFAFTPVVASMFGHSMEDGALTVCLVLAADSWQRAVTSARLRSLVWAGVWVGVGFQAKMLQAWIILPALTVGYLLAAPARLRRRLWHLGVAGAVTLAVSLSWIALYALTPATARPYVDGSTNNSAFALVFGYNGLERFGVRVPGAISAGPGVMVRFNGGNWAGTAYQLFGSGFGPQIAWLVPLSLLALVAGLAACGRARRADPLRAGLVMWGIWLVTFGEVFSEMGVVTHTAYVASFAPPVAALSGAGIVMFWRWYRAGDWRGLVLPLTVAAEVAWAVRLWSFFPTFLPWARQVLIVVGALAVVTLVTAWPWRRHPRLRLEGVGSSTRGGSVAGTGAAAGSRTGAASGAGGGAGTRAGARAGIRGRVAAAGLATGVAAMLAAPAAWALSVLDVAYAGTSFDAIAGPSGAPYAAHIRRAVTTVLGGVDRRIYTYVSAHRGGASYLMAAQDWDQASPYILATGQEVLPLGGFSGLAPEPTLAHVQQLAGGQLRFFQLGGGQAGAAARGTSFERVKIIRWVEASCRVIPPKEYGVSAANTRPSSGLNGGPVTLYECGTGG